MGTEGNAYVTGITYSPDFPTTDLPVLAAAPPSGTGDIPRFARTERVRTEAVTQPLNGGGIDGFVVKVPGCARPDFKDSYPLDTIGKRALLSTPIGRYGNKGGWNMEAGISAQDGLVLRRVKLGERLMAEQINIPYLLIKTNKMANPVRVELKPNDPKSNQLRNRLVFYKDSSIKTNRLANFNFPDPATFENYNSAEALGDDTFFVMATYMIENFGSSGSCLKVVQRDEFDGGGSNCEPSNTLTCRRFFPMVKYVFYGGGDEKLEYVNIVQRNHFSDEGKPRNVAGLFKDCDAPPLLCGGLLFSGKYNPVDRETLFDPSFYPEGRTVLKNGQPGSWDNYHHTYNDDVLEPSVSLLGQLKLGCPECIHVHWRWGKAGTQIVNNSRQFNYGELIIPKGSKQNVDIAVSLYKSYETHPTDSASVLNLEPLTYIGYTNPPKNMGGVFWYSGKSSRENESCGSGLFPGCRAGLYPRRLFRRFGDS